MSKKDRIVFVSLVVLCISVACLLFIPHTYKMKTLDSAYVKTKSQLIDNSQQNVLNKFNLEDANGKSFNMGMFNGKKVVLIYWKYNCNNCLAAIDEIGYLYQLSLEKPDLVVVRVSDLQYKENTIKVANEKQLREPIFFDKDLSSLSKAVQLDDDIDYPIQVYVNSDGTLREVLKGSTDKDQMLQVLSRLN